MTKMSEPFDLPDGPFRIDLGGKRFRYFLDSYALLCKDISTGTVEKRPVRNGASSSLGWQKMLYQTTPWVPTSSNRGSKYLQIRLISTIPPRVHQHESTRDRKPHTCP